VPTSLIEKFGGFVGENHTVILEQTGPEAVLNPEELASLLGTPEVERYFRCISGATNVSAFELSQLALPDPAKLKRCLKAGMTMKDAVRTVVFES
jgi:adenine-specific DNA-methyltransferase